MDDKLITVVDGLLAKALAVPEAMNAASFALAAFHAANTLRVLADIETRNHTP